MPTFHSTSRPPLLLTALLLAGTGLAPAAEPAESPPPPPGGLVVQVDGLRETTGQVVLQLFESAEGFKTRRPDREVSLTPEDGQVRWALPDLAPGTYAVRAHHDVNDNGEVDRSRLGLPREPLGLSNNPVLIGPPSFRQARFDLPSTGELLTLKLRTPTDSANRWRLGVGAVVRSKVYKDQEDLQVTGIPFVTYFGERFFWTGPFAGYRLINREQTQINFRAAYRFDGYEADDSSALTGMEDRDGTLELGLSVARKLPAKFELSLRGDHDVLDTYGSGRASLDLDRSFSGKSRLINLGVGAEWQSSAFTSYYFGVRPGEATDERAAYDPGDAFNLTAKALLIQSLWKRWDLFLAFNLEWLDTAISDSPIVGSDYLLSSVAGVTYRF